MDISIAIRRTKEKIIQELNASGLPADVMVYILQDVTEQAKAEAERNYKLQLQKEAQRQLAEKS